MTNFLTFEQIIAIHDSQIELFGGSHGIRDFTLLESALMRPQATFGGKDLYDTIFDKAAVLMHSLIMNHPFIDGNKRTGTVSTIAFLKLNELTLMVDQEELVDAALKLESKKWSIEQVSDWLKENSEKEN